MQKGLKHGEGSISEGDESGDVARGHPVAKAPFDDSSRAERRGDGCSDAGNSPSRLPASGTSAIGDVRGESSSGERDLAIMRLALEAAEGAAKRGEVPVGAVVARGDEVLAVAANEREATKDPTAHAELLAIRRASAALGGWRLAGCTLYATLEPCPMCAGAAHASRLSRIVYAAPDPKAGYAGTLHDTPGDTRLNHLIPVESGLLGEEAATLLRSFFKARRSKNPKPERAEDNPPGPTPAP